MKVTIPNPDRPAEVTEIERFMSMLEDCKVQGGWNIAMLDKHLSTRETVWRALERLDNVMDDLYPPTAIETVQTTEKASEAA